MKRLLVHELSLMSKKERRARKIQFHRKATIIKGGNDTGKSSIIKSIYSTLGADPAKIHPKWVEANVMALLKFEVDGEVFFIFRYQKSFSLYNSDGGIIETHHQITKGIGLTVASLLDFRLLLTDRKQEAVIPPPAYIFIPFYIDQDSGWTETWSSFKGLRQFPNWRKNVVEYHTGIYPNQFYKLKSDADALKLEMSEPKIQQKSLMKLRRTHESKLAVADFDIDVSAFQQEIERLLSICQELKLEEDKYKETVMDLRNQETFLKNQKVIAQATKKSLENDYDYLNKNVSHAIECPTCGNHYDNIFEARFALASDVEDCDHMILEIGSQLERLREVRLVASRELNSVRSQLFGINALLSEKKNAVTLQQLIDNEGKKKMGSLLDDEIAIIGAEITKLETLLLAVESQMKKYRSKERRAAIVDLYQNLMQRYLIRLQVSNMSNKDYKSIYSSIKEIGSDLPRAQLAYIMAILQVINQKGAGVFCPVVIDSPQQQDQDEGNYAAMLNLIKDELPNESQLILALVDDAGVDFGGSVVEMTEPLYAMLEEEYSDVNAEMEPFISAHIQASP